LPPEPQPEAARLEVGDDGRRHAPAASRNQAPLTAALADLLPAAGRVLELASGTGQHAAHWAQAFPSVRFQPSDPEPAARRSIAAWAAHAGVANLLPPLALDVMADGWWRDAPGPWDALVAVNLLHISPWRASRGLFEGAGATLESQGRLVLYGPFAEAGMLEPESNRAFDAALRAQNREWGVRDTRELAALAAPLGLRLGHRIAMPANNLVLVWERGPCA
jgi:SAM-dependent methyltransferase